MGYKDKRFRYEDDPTLLTYDQLLDKLQQMFAEADFTYGVATTGGRHPRADPCTFAW